MTTLQPITWSNADAIYELEVDDSQKDFVAPNSFSITEAYASLHDDSVPTRHTFAICNNDKVVGFAMIYFDTGDNNPFKDDNQPYYFFNRFMVGKEFQKRGYGTAAMSLIIEHVKTWPQGKAASFYTSFGFVETGESMWDEVVTRLVF